MTLTELAQGYIGRGLTIVHEYYGDYDRRYREMRQQITDEINPLLIKHGAELIAITLVPDPDQWESDE
jgi:hypothetical protein